MNEKIKISMDIVNELRKLSAADAQKWYSLCLTEYPEMKTVIDILYETAMR